MKANPLVIFGEKRFLSLALLGILVLISALAVVYAKHLNRSFHIRLEQLQHLQDRLHVEQTQLLLEQGTLGSDLRVEKVAREQLEMIVPPPTQIVVIKP